MRRWGGGCDVGSVNYFSVVFELFMTSSERFVTPHCTRRRPMWKDAHHSLMLHSAHAYRMLRATRCCVCAVSVL